MAYRTPFVPNHIKPSKVHKDEKVWSIEFYYIPVVFYHRQCNMWYTKRIEDSRFSSSYQKATNNHSSINTPRCWVTGIRAVQTIHQSLYVHTNSCSLFIKWLTSTIGSAARCNPPLANLVVHYSIDPMNAKV